MVSYELIGARLVRPMRRRTRARNLIIVNGSIAVPLICRGDLLIVTGGSYATPTINSVCGPSVVESNHFMGNFPRARIDRKSSCNTSSNRGFRPPATERPRQ